MGWMLNPINRKLIANDEMHLYVDSQSVLLALTAHFIKSKLLWETISLLNQCIKHTTVKFIALSWIKGHEGHYGNELADKLAKEALTQEVTANIPLITEREINNEIKRLMHLQWQREWQAEPTCRQTRLFYPYLRPEHSWEIISSSRLIYSTFVQFETGHNFMARHQHLIDSNQKDYTGGSTPTCRLCGTDEQTSAHIIAQCHTLIQLRVKYFKTEFLNPPYINLEKRALLGFLREAPIEELHYFIEG